MRGHVEESSRCEQMEACLVPEPFVATGLVIQRDDGSALL